MANLHLMLAEAGHAAAAGAAHHAPQPEIWGLGPVFWVSLSMTIFFAILLWKKVPAAVGKMLDGQIAAIRQQLDEASSLRQEAEALKLEYAKRLANLDGEAKAMHARAEEEASRLIAKAKSDAESLIARRQRMAEDRIAAAERSAIAEVRERAANAAVGAAQSLLAAKHDAKADTPVVDRAVDELSAL